MSTRSRARWVATVACLTAMFLGGALLKVADARQVQTERERVRERGLAVARELERRVEGLLSAFRTLALVVDPAASPREFDQLAARFLESHEGARGIQLASQGKVRHAYPPETAALIPGEEDRAALRHRSGGPRARPDRFVLEGPYVAGPGDLLLRGWLPARPDSDEGRHPRTELGLLIDMRRLFESVDFASMTRAGNDYRLSRKDSQTGRALTLVRSTELDLRDPEEIDLRLPGESWTLSLAPRVGWRFSTQFGTGLVLVLLVGLVGGATIFQLLRQPEELREELSRSRERFTEVWERLHHEALHDLLTGLPNRAHFVARLESALERARGVPNCAVGVLIMDLDHFTAIDGSLGRSASDELLKEVGRRLSGCLHAEHTVARVGGDEFAVLIFDVKEASLALRVADRLRAELLQPLRIDREEVSAKASIGVALTSAAGEGAEELLRNADIAVNQARSQGGARTVLFEKEMQARAVARTRLEKEIQRGIERQEFVSFYQPIVNLKDGTIKGFESLVRWQHPDRGIIPPAEFLPVAESTDLIIPIDRWIFQQSVEQVRDWQKLFPRSSPLTISANFSGKEFGRADIAPWVRDALRTIAIDPETVYVEITESVMMNNVELAMQILAQFKELRVHLSLDDFGTGYSSLSYLHRLPLSCVKIDRSFVWSMVDNVKTVEIIRIVLGLARTLNMEVVAEGIETVEQLQKLREMGCPFAQGYHFSKPVDVKSAEALLVSNPRW
jgi:diguanylate cyclase (GGDEF)-like protein